MNIQTKGIACLEDALKTTGLDYSFTGKCYPKNITSMIIAKTPMTTTTWDSSDFKDLAEKIMYMYNEDYTMKDMKKFIASYDVSMTDASGEYVKDSYRNSHMSLHDLLLNALKGISYAQDKFQTVFDARATHEFKSTESAFLYKGYYITPCILRDIIELAWNDCTKEQQREYLSKFYNDCKKVDIKTLATDCLSDMFNHDNIDRLIMIDNFRLQNTKGVGV